MISRGSRYANIFIFISAGMSNQEVSLLRVRILTSFAPVVARPAVAVVSLVTIVRSEGTTVEPSCEFDHSSEFARSNNAGTRTPGIVGA
jgi:hypothetical protein